MLTILLPTHRPEFFDKALESVFVAKEKSKVITNLIINCDKKDTNNNCKYLDKYQKLIKKYFNKNYKFIYTQNQSINDIYRNLIDNVMTKYFYFLEDDDILLTNFNFIKKYNLIDYFIGLYKINNKHEDFNESKIINEIKNINFINSKPEVVSWYQLGQVVFKTEKIKWFPEKIHTYNDFYLLQKNLELNRGKIKIIFKYFFKQGWSADSFSQNFWKDKKG